MKVVIAIGDVLEMPADVLISSANPWLNMSGGVNGAIRARCPEIQGELRAYLASIGKPAVAAGSVVRTSAGSLPFVHIVHAVTVDPFYGSSIELVGGTLAAAFELAQALGGRSVSLPTLATGYGPLSIADFANAFARTVIGRFDLEIATIAVRNSENAESVNAVLDAT